MGNPTTPQTPLQTLRGDKTIPRKLVKALEDVHTVLNGIKANVSNLQTAVATPPTTVTTPQLQQIQKALGNGGSNALFASQAIAQIPTKDPKVVGEVWLNNGVFQVSAG